MLSFPSYVAILKSRLQLWWVQVVYSDKTFHFQCIINFALTIFLGELRHITKLKPWPLYQVLTEKYEWDTQTAKVSLKEICIIYSFYFPNHCENLEQKYEFDFAGVCRLSCPDVGVRSSSEGFCPGVSDTSLPGWKIGAL